MKDMLAKHKCGKTKKNCIVRSSLGEEDGEQSYSLNKSKIYGIKHEEDRKAARHTVNVLVICPVVVSDPAREHVVVAVERLADDSDSLQVRVDVAWYRCRYQYG